MSHAGPFPRPDDGHAERRSSETHGQRQPVDGARQDSSCGVYHRDDLTSKPESNLPIQEARADSALPNETLPFVVQAGQILFLVAEEREDWVLAELRFDPVSCTFAEERRARFQWPREVFGRLLSRTIVGQDFDVDEANRVADAFLKWLAAQYVTTRGAR